MPSAGKLIRAFIESYAELKPDELRAQLLDLRETIVDLEDENKRLREENKDLMEALMRRKAMEYHDGGYYVFVNDAEVGPVCPECYEAKGLIYPLQTTSSGVRCSVCEKHYPVPESTVSMKRRGAMVL